MIHSASHERVSTARLPTRLALLAMVTAVAALSGCSGSSQAVAQAKPLADQTARSGHAARSARFVVFGVDRTERYDQMTKRALALAEQDLMRSAPGDELYFRWISDRSYRSDELIVHVRLPEVPRNLNPFDAREKALALAAQGQVRAAAERALNTLRTEAPATGTSSTDIYGFVTAAAEYFSRAPSSAQKLLVLASDMEDNRRYRVRPKLNGVDVRVYLFVIKKHPDPAYYARLKSRWTKYFADCGAAQVEFLPAG